MTPLAAAANENLAQLSNYLVYSSMAVYTLAFLAHITEWTFGSRSKVARTAAALTTAKSAQAPAVQVRSQGGTAVLDRPKVVTRSASGSRDVPDGPGAAGGTAQGDLYGRVAVSLTVLGFLIEAAGVVTRAMSVQRAPWGNMYEFSVTFSTVAVGAYLVLLLLKKNVRWLGLILITTVLLDLGIATTWLYTDSDQLVPPSTRTGCGSTSRPPSSAVRCSTSARPARCCTCSATPTRPTSKPVARRAGSVPR